MILFKSTPISFIQQDAIMLEVDNNLGYIYLSRNTYDQVLLLNDRFEGEIALLKKLLGIDATNHDAVTYFYNNAPEPLSILAPFIAMIKPGVPVSKDLRLLCGYLHQMSMAIDFNAFTKVPQEVRANVAFTKSTLLNFEQAWGDLEIRIKSSEIEVDSVNIELIKAIVSEITGSIQVPAVTQEPVKHYERAVIEDIIEDDEEDYEDPWAALAADMAEAIGSVKVTPDVKEDVKEEASVLTDKEVKKSEEDAAIDKLLAVMSGGM